MLNDRSDADRRRLLPSQRAPQAPGNPGRLGAQLMLSEAQHAPAGSPQFGGDPLVSRARLPETLADQ